ncbi:hypothetical protein evm_006773, partial [Chilo suppressalis]
MPVPERCPFQKDAIKNNMNDEITQLIVLFIVIAIDDWRFSVLQLGYRHHHQPINVPTAGALAFPMDGIGRLGHDLPREPIADWKKKHERRKTFFSNHRPRQTTFPFHISKLQPCPFHQLRRPRPRGDQLRARHCRERTRLRLRRECANRSRVTVTWFCVFVGFPHSDFVDGVCEEAACAVMRRERPGSTHACRPRTRCGCDDMVVGVGAARARDARPPRAPGGQRLPNVAQVMRGGGRARRLPVGAGVQPAGRTARRRVCRQIHVRILLPPAGEAVQPR